MGTRVAITRDNDDDDDDEEKMMMTMIMIMMMLANIYGRDTRRSLLSPGIEPNVFFSLFHSNVHSRGTIISRGHAFGLFFFLPRVLDYY